VTGVELGTRERLRRAARTGGAIAGIYIGYKGLSWLDRGPLRGVVGAARRRWAVRRRCRRGRHECEQDRKSLHADRLPQGGGQHLT